MLYWLRWLRKVFAFYKSIAFKRFLVLFYFTWYINKIHRKQVKRCPEDFQVLFLCWKSLFPWQQYAYSKVRYKYFVFLKRLKSLRYRSNFTKTIQFYLSARGEILFWFWDIFPLSLHTMVRKSSETKVKRNSWGATFTWLECRTVIHCIYGYYWFAAS
jgi:hypothetical protein